MSGTRVGTNTFQNWLGLLFRMCQTRTLYSPILVFHSAIALLRLALASNTFIVYAHRKSFFIHPEILETQDINPLNI